jgi:uncharacterized protein (DUF2141 family)
MNHTKISQIFAACTLALPVLAFAELPTLTVNVTHAVPSLGEIEVTLFDSAENFLTTVYLQKSGVPDENGQFTANFSGLEEGEYAVVVVHDENGNETYDAGILGFGSEGLGYSNNVRQWFSRPDFDEAKFMVEGETTEITVELQ